MSVKIILNEEQTKLLYEMLLPELIRIEREKQAAAAEKEKSPDKRD
ncbi:hypothetical protein [Fictibacillus norfolkensis]|uniref:Uncharacterized protein n=1 Tax=Fictibacillus norfolkensis TaxID=2762233 RepID=A0ABR8SSE0_9BACL|nr:hypothetical protein [Fictibacillus norfolkensis]MBD7966268.1 hypothetical protein [Fictibacillus norfolkensis]